MCNCEKYCPHCGQLKPQQPYQGYWSYRTYPYPTWIPNTGAISGGCVPQTFTVGGPSNS